MRPKRQSPEDRRDAAEILALRAVAYVLADERRARRFVALTGFDPDGTHVSGVDAAIQRGVLEYLLGDEPTLIEFCAWAEVDPAAPAEALRLFVGPEQGA